MRCLRNNCKLRFNPSCLKRFLYHAFHFEKDKTMKIMASDACRIYYIFITLLLITKSNFIGGVSLSTKFSRGFDGFLNTH